MMIKYLPFSSPFDNSASYRKNPYIYTDPDLCKDSFTGVTFPTEVLASPYWESKG